MTMRGNNNETSGPTVPLWREEDPVRSLEEVYLGGKPTGPHVSTELIEAASLLPTSHPSDGWNVLLCPSRDQVMEYVPRILAYSGVLELEMTKRGFTKEATDITKKWILKRFLDRVKINNESFQKAVYEPIPKLKSVQDRALIGVANPAQRALLRYGIGAKNIEYGRLIAPECRLESRDEKREVVDATVTLLGGTAINSEASFSVEEYAIVGSDTLVSVHEKRLITELPDQSLIARRIAYTALLGGHVHRNDIESLVRSEGLEGTDAFIPESEVDYGYGLARRFGSQPVYADGL